MARSSPPASSPGDSLPPPAAHCANPATLDCIAHSDSLHIVIHNSRLALSPAAVFDVQRLDGILQPDTPGTAIDLDRPATFSIAVISGRIQLSPAQLTRLMNQRVFAFPQASIRRLKVATHGDRLLLSGQYRRRGWVGFRLAGRVDVAGARAIEISADSLHVDGRPAGALLRAAHLALGDILKLHATGVSIAGNRLRLDIAQLLPPPRLQMKIRKATVDSDGLKLVLGDAPDAADTAQAANDVTALPRVPASAFILLHGGQLSLGPLHLPDPRVELTAQTEDAPLALDLPGYRRQLARTTITLLPTQSDASHPTFLARLPLPEPAP